jgi:hypothetical protein
LSVGAYHILALRSDGSLIGWGDNGSGQCNVPPGSYVRVAAGIDHSLALRTDGTVVAWGDNAYGQTSVPPLPPGLSYVDLAAGRYFSVALRSDGSVAAWGNNDSRQCTVLPLPPGLKYVDVAAGYDHTIARRSDGTAVAWGSNWEGQCDVPQIPPGLSFVEIDGGLQHSVARLSDASIVGWGNNQFHQTEAPEPPAGFSYAQIASGMHFVGAVLQPSWPTPVAYCTGKLNSLGCVPAISAVGIPSATFGNGFTLRTPNVVGHRSVMYVHGTMGPQTLAFHGGILCVQVPLMRHAPTTSGGAAGTCDGVLSEDFNTYIASGVDPALVPGASVWIQNWSRDPGGVISDSLSNALQLIISP